MVGLTTLFAVAAGVGFALALGLWLQGQNFSQGTGRVPRCVAGRMQLESTLGKGTRVTCFLPPKQNVAEITAAFGDGD